jgi:hypothetical protein
MIKTMDWAIRKQMGQPAYYVLNKKITTHGKSLLEALKADYSRDDGCAAAAYWREARNNDEHRKEEQEYARQVLAERYLEDAIEDWEADIGHPDLFSDRLTASYDGGRPTEEDIEVPEEDVDREVQDLESVAFEQAWSDFTHSINRNNLDDALEAIGLCSDDVTIDEYTCATCELTFKWFWRFCDNCEEPLCPHCDPFLNHCFCCEEDCPWTAHERIFLAMQKRKDRPAARDNKIDTDQQTRKEERCMDGS